MARRPMAVALLAGLAVLAMVLVAKDLNDKLGVMTASNQEYQVGKSISPTIRFPPVTHCQFQEMTDSQAHKIKKLQVNKPEKNSFSRKRNLLFFKINFQSDLKEEHSRAEASARRFRSTESELREKGERERGAAEKASSSMRTRMDELQREHDALRKEYEELSENSLKVIWELSLLLY